MHRGLRRGCGRRNRPSLAEVWTGLSAWLAPEPQRHLATFEPSSRGEITSIQGEFSTLIQDKNERGANKSSDTKLVALIIKCRGAIAKRDKRRPIRASAVFSPQSQNKTPPPHSLLLVSK